jgi:hypothetical protein
MSGALISLVAKGAQDVYITNNESETSFFKMKYTRHTNFSQAVKPLEIIGQVMNNGVSSVPIRSLGDLINGVWLTGGSNWSYQLLNNSQYFTPSQPIQAVIPNVNVPFGIYGYLTGTIFDLYIGGQLIDSQSCDFLTDVWPIYMADSYTKAKAFYNAAGNGYTDPDCTFFPLHFFFCDNEMFLPLLALQYHQVEIRIRWGPYIGNMLVDGGTPVKMYGNFIYLDTNERETFINKQMDMLITQVQTNFSSYTISDTTGSTNIDLSVINHPVKCIYFGYNAVGPTQGSCAWTFKNAEIFLNGTSLLENMTPEYFHMVQGYYNTKYGNINFDSIQTNSPFFTQYFSYNFCLDSTSYKPTGTCNFSRLDNATLNIDTLYCMYIFGFQPFLTPLTVHAVNYNVLRIKAGMAGILFSN